MNRTLKVLMASDMFYFTGFGLVAPIVAIFIKEDLTGGTIFTAGIATTIFIVIKSLIQLPFSRFIDAHNQKVKWVKIGYTFIILNPFIYFFADHINYIYLAEALHGLGSGLAFPAWLGLWSTHLDKGHESFEWSLYSTMVGVGSAITAAVGAAITEFVGFNLTFLMVGVMSIAGFVALFFLKDGHIEKGKQPIDISEYHTRQKMHQNHRHNNNKRSI